MHEIIDINALQGDDRKKREYWLTHKQRWMIFLLYPESQQHAIDYIRCNFPCLCIYHDRDENKPHYHFVVHFENGRFPQAVCKRLGVSTQWVQQPRSEIGVEQYLTHDTKAARKAEKFIYPADAIECLNGYEYKAEEQLKTVDTLTIANEMFALMQGCKSYHEFVAGCLANNYYGELKRSSYIWGTLWNEHKQGAYSGQ